MKMKSKIFAVVVLLGLCGSAFAVRYPSLLPKATKVEVEEELADMPYKVKGSSLTETGQVTFYGYATDVHFIVKGATTIPVGQATFWGSFSNSSTTIYNNDNLDIYFKVPVDSPTIVNFTLRNGATVQTLIGGFKKDADTN